MDTSAKRRIALPWLVAVALAAGMGLAGAEDASGQLFLGGHAARSGGPGGTVGAGLRLGLGVPALPVDAVVGGEFFMPDCPAGGCSFQSGFAALNLRMPFPGVRPYATGGLTWRRFDVARRGVAADSGWFLGGGVDVGLPGFRVFAEWTREFLASDDPLQSGVVKVGFLIGR